MGNHDQLEQQAEYLHGYLDLQVVQIVYEDLLHDEVLEILQIDVVFQQLEVPQEDQDWVDQGPWDDSDAIRYKVAFQILPHYFSRIRPSVRRLAFEEVESDIEYLDRADDDVAELLLHELEVLAHHEVVVRHDEACQDEVVEQRDRDDQVEVFELLVLREDQQLAVPAEELHVEGLVPRAAHMLDLVVLLLGLLVTLHH